MIQPLFVTGRKTPSSTLRAIAPSLEFEACSSLEPRATTRKLANIIEYETGVWCRLMTSRGEMIAQMHQLLHCRPSTRPVRLLKLPAMIAWSRGSWCREMNFDLADIK